MSNIAYSFIGLRVNERKLYKQKRVRACQCDISDAQIATANFCSHCGKEIFECKNIPIEGYEEGDKFFDYRVIIANEAEEAYICMYGTCDVGNGGAMLKFPDSFDFNIEKEKMKKLLEPYGVWNEDKFGLWSYIS